MHPSKITSKIIYAKRQGTAAVETPVDYGVVSIERDK